MSTGQTIGPPMRTQDGFGCPACGAPLPTDGNALLRATRWARGAGLPCCGYWPDNDTERLRWVLAGRAMLEHREAA